jgi:peroxiredoxin
MTLSRKVPEWMILVVRIAAVYHFVLGLIMFFFPTSIFDWIQISPPNYLLLWQTLGAMVALFGLAYYLASYNIVKHYPVILVGLLSNTFITIAFVYAYLTDQIQDNFFWLVFVNDVVWLAPFTLIWAYIFKAFQDTSLNLNVEIDEALENFYLSDSGESLYTVSQTQPVILIFLRHFGCSFCREMLHELSESRMDFWNKNHRMVIVHMSSDEEAYQYLKLYNLESVAQISDPACVLYEAFGVSRATYSQTFHIKSWWKAFVLMCKGVFIGKLSGDGFRKAASAIIYKGEIMKVSKPEYVFEQPDLI